MQKLNSYKRILCILDIEVALILVYEWRIVTKVHDTMLIFSSPQTLLSGHWATLHYSLRIHQATFLGPSWFWRLSGTGRNNMKSWKKVKNLTIMSPGQHSDSGPGQHSDSEQDSQLSNKSSYKVGIKLLIRKRNKFDHRFDYALFHGDFCKFLSWGGWAGKRAICRAGLTNSEILAKSKTSFFLEIIL